MTQDRLAIFIPPLDTGKAKPELIPVVGDALAASVQTWLVKRTLDWAMSQIGKMEIKYYGEGEINRVLELDGVEHKIQALPFSNPGRRLEEIFSSAFEEEFGRLVYCDTDCPEMDEKRCGFAFSCLRYTDLVLGTSEDGGVYLIGAKKWDESLFKNIDWGSPREATQIMENARKLGWLIRLLEILPTIRHPEDMDYFDFKGLRLDNLEK